MYSLSAMIVEMQTAKKTLLKLFDPANGTSTCGLQTCVRQRIAFTTKEMQLITVLKMDGARSAKDEKDRHLCFFPRRCAKGTQPGRAGDSFNCRRI
jgi:hypothetical protein